MKNLYKVITSYNGNQNFGHYYVSAGSGIEAMAFVNLLTFKKRSKVQRERAEGVKYIAPIEHDSMEFAVRGSRTR